MRKLIAALSAALLLIAIPAQACIIELAICGFQSMSEAMGQLDYLPDWTILHPHELMPMGDGTFFVEFTLKGVQRGDACFAEFTPVNDHEVYCTNPTQGSMELGKVWRKK